MTDKLVFVNDEFRIPAGVVGFARKKTKKTSLKIFAACNYPLLYRTAFNNIKLNRTELNSLQINLPQPKIIEVSIFSLSLPFFR